jgi:hypothetical protein
VKEKEEVFRIERKTCCFVLNLERERAKPRKREKE